MAERLSGSRHVRASVSKSLAADPHTGSCSNAPAKSRFNEGNPRQRELPPLQCGAIG